MHLDVYVVQLIRVVGYQCCARVDRDERKRLAAKFDWNYEEQMNTLLSVKTVFNQVVEESSNLVMKAQKHKTYPSVPI